MERHSPEKDEQPQRVGRSERHRVDPDERRHKQVADQQEVDDHPFVADMVGRRPAEDRRVIKDPQG